MRKRINTLNASEIIHSGSFCDVKDHFLIPEKVLADIERACKGKVDAFMFGTCAKLPDETIYGLAELAVKNNLHFGVIYAYQFPPEGQRSMFSREMVQKIYDIAGDLFMGEYFGETGTNLAAKDKNYFVLENPRFEALQMPPQNFNDMQEAKDNYVAFIRKMVEYDKNALGIRKTMLIEPTAFSRYNLEGGIDIAVLEMLPGDPDYLTAFTRGASIGYRRKEWYGYIANEWYGGFYHEDSVKEKRLELSYKWLYISGANLINLESGPFGLSSFGYKLPASSPESRGYRRVQKAFHEFLKTDQRLPCGPVAKVGFIHGNLDGYTDFMGGWSWCQFKDDWALSDAERSWKILGEVYKGRPWHDICVHTDDGRDFSASPAYGMYDVIPAESPLEVYEGYDTLIFAGWNTMTKDLYEKLKAYVAGGGHLLISAAHLNTSAKRGAAPEFVDGVELADFLGCNIVGEYKMNGGVKFCRNGTKESVRYPASKDLMCDAYFPSGFANWAKVEMKGGKVMCFFSDTFNAPEPESEVSPVLVENNYGKGSVSFMTNIDYPGAAGVYKLYSVIVKELLTDSHRNCDLKVVASDKVRYAFYFDDATGKEKLYLLNTDYNCSCGVTVYYKDTVKKLTLKPVQLKSIDF